MAGEAPQERSRPGREIWCRPRSCGRVPRGRGATRLKRALLREASVRRRPTPAAFELAPGGRAVGARHSRSLAAQGTARRGRRGAHVIHARVRRGPPRRRRRGGPGRPPGAPRQNALREGEPARAVGAVLDGRFEAEVEGDSAIRVDEALSAAGLYELYAARLEFRGERQRTASALAPSVYLALARLYAGPLASPERALEAWIAVLGADPSNDGALTALREHATHTGDHGALVEALIRVGESASGTAAARIAAMRTLVGVAEGPFDAPALAAWALDHIGEAGGVTDMLAAEAAPRPQHRRRSIRKDDGLRIDLAESALWPAGPTRRGRSTRSVASPPVTAAGPSRATRTPRRSASSPA